MDAGVFTYETHNLGDEVQAFAALAHLDRVGAFIDRDRVADFVRPGQTACVFNAWFGHTDDCRLPSTSLQPIWYGFTAGYRMLNSPWVEYLAGCGPVGCRDLFTREFLGGRGVDAYWSGCLTLFLGTALGLPARERRGVLFVDVPPAAESFMPADLVRQATRLSMFPPPGIVFTPLERWAMVGRLMQQLASAELVVTRRLHVALPAASFATPVVAIPDPEVPATRRRFSGVETILPTVFLDRAEQDLARIDWRNVPPAQVPRELSERHAALRELLTAGGMAHRAPASPSPLDDTLRTSQRLINLERIVRPGRVALRLHDRTFELHVRGWSDRYIDVALDGFPGLSKFAFEVLVRCADDDAWIECGQLRDIVSGEGPDRTHTVAA